MSLETPYAVEFPEYFDDYAHEIEAKGYFADLTITYGNTVLRPVIFDPTRLAQEYNDEFARGSSFFAVPLLLVVPEVTRDRITSAVAELAKGGFRDLVGG